MKAAGLNILGSFCGLSILCSNLQGKNPNSSDDFSNFDENQSYFANFQHYNQHEVFDSERGMDYDYDQYAQAQFEALNKN